MRMKTEFMELSKKININVDEDLILFIGFFNNFYLCGDFESDKEIKESIELYFNIKLNSTSRMEMITEFSQRILLQKEEDYLENSFLLNRIFLAMAEKKNNEYNFKNSYEALYERI